MVNFVVTGSGVVNLSDQVFTGFVGITYQANGNLTVLLKSTQFAPLALPSDSNFIGSNFRDTLDISIKPNATFLGSSFSFFTWSNGDRIIIHDAFNGNENITGTPVNDIFTVTGGNDTVDGNFGTADLLVIDYSSSVSSFGTAGSTIANFSDTAVTFSNIERFDVRVGSGNDSIRTGDGYDILSGGAGDDILNSAKGRAEVDGGTGTDQWIADFSTDSTAKTINLNLAGIQNADDSSTYARIERLEFTGGNGNDVIITRLGNVNDGLRDILNAGAGNDVLTVGGGEDVVDGGDGDDLLVIDYSGETANIGTAGSVIADFSNTSVSFSNIERFDVTLGSGNDNLVLGGGSDVVKGGAGDDSLNTAAGAAVVDGGTGRDQWVANFSGDASAKTINLNLAGVQSAGNGSTYARIERLDFTGGSGNDVITTRTSNANDGLRDLLNGGGGNDIITVGGGEDVVDGGDGIDLLVIDYSSETANIGTAGSVIADFSNTSVSFANFERLNVTSGSGNDNISLGAGKDRLQGNGGADTLAGGGGADRFVYVSVADSTAASRDTITDFNDAVDRLDLKSIDAVAGGADNAFALIGNAAFTAAGQLRVFNDGVNTFVEVNTGGSVAADMQIQLSGLHTLDASNIIL